MIIETKCYGQTIYFDDEKHKFWSDTQKNIDSVTKFTGILDKGGLTYWAVGLMNDYLCERLGSITIEDLDYASDLHTQKKTEAADLGTRIHELVSKHIKGEEIDLDKLLAEDPRVSQGFDSFIEWEKKVKPQWLASERIVYSKKYNYAGILDAVAKINGKVVLIDFKSSNNLYEEYAFQTAAYQIANEEMGLEKIDHRIVIRFSKDTEEEYNAKELKKKIKKERQRKPYYKPEPYAIFEQRDYKENKKDKDAFVAMIKVKRRLDELKRWTSLDK